jgi:hypothetical protein
MWKPSDEDLQRLYDIVEFEKFSELLEPWEPYRDIRQAFMVIHSLQGRPKEWFYEMADQRVSVFVRLWRYELDDEEMDSFDGDENDVPVTSVFADPTWQWEDVDEETGEVIKLGGDVADQPIECVAICQAALKALDVEENDPDIE